MRKRFDYSRYDLGEITDPDSGLLGKQFPHAKLQVYAECWIESGAAILPLLPRGEDTNPYGDYTNDNRDFLVHDRRDWNYVEVSNDLLDRFIKLADASSDQVLAFAKKWGPLGLCWHNLPTLHPQFSNTQAEDGWTVCPPRSIEGREFQCGESVAMWHRYARKFRAMLNLAATLRQGAKPDAADLDCVWPQKDLELHYNQGRWYRLLGSKEAVKPGATIVAVPIWFELSEEMNRLLSIVNAKPYLESDPDGNRSVVLSGIGLLPGALAIQLLTALAGEQPFAFCSWCTERYEPERRPRAGEHHYCDDCRSDGVPQRLATERRKKGLSKKRRPTAKKRRKKASNMRRGKKTTAVKPASPAPAPRSPKAAVRRQPRPE
jgi:hypothetical protein